MLKKDPKVTEFVALARKIGFPRGKCSTDRTVARPHCPAELYMTWTKRGGHAGGEIADLVISKARDVGFTRRAVANGHSPDGSFIGAESVYTLTLPNGSLVNLSVSKHYGSGAADNYFTMRLVGPNL